MCLILYLHIFRAYRIGFCKANFFQVHHGFLPFFLSSPSPWTPLLVSCLPDSSSYTYILIMFVYKNLGSLKKGNVTFSGLEFGLFSQYDDFFFHLFSRKKMTYFPFLCDSIELHCVCMLYSFLRSCGQARGWYHHGAPAHSTAVSMGVDLESLMIVSRRSSAWAMLFFYFLENPVPTFTVAGQFTSHQQCLKVPLSHTLTIFCSHIFFVTVIWTRIIGSLSEVLMSFP